MIFVTFVIIHYYYFEIKGLNYYQSFLAVLQVIVTHCLFHLEVFQLLITVLNFLRKKKMDFEVFYICIFSFLPCSYLLQSGYSGMQGAQL